MVAKFSVVVVTTTSILISIVFAAIVLIFRVGLSELFTSDSEVIQAVSNLTPLLAISVFTNVIQPILSGKKLYKAKQALRCEIHLKHVDFQEWQLGVDGKLLWPMSIWLLTTSLASQLAAFLASKPLWEWL